jgi:C1A family cysteine protease
VFENVPGDKNVDIYYDKGEVLHRRHTIPVEDGWIQDQGTYGAAAANAIAYAIRVVRRRADLTDFQPSRFFIYYQGRMLEGREESLDMGMYISSGLRAVEKFSVCSEETWAYDDKKIFCAPTEYALVAARNHPGFQSASVLQDEMTLKHCLLEGNPIIFGLTVFTSFMSSEAARTGILVVPDVDREEQNGGHVLVLIGFDDDIIPGGAFRFSNSFSGKWGQNGTGYMPYELVLNPEYARDFHIIRKSINIADMTTV